MVADIFDLGHVSLRNRPLVICDVDDVVLQFITPFQAFVESRGYRFLPRSFRLHGNIVSGSDEKPLEDSGVSSLIEGFFEAQDQWQTPFDLVAQKLHTFSADADIVFLTAMPPQFHQRRRRLLDRLGFAFPLLSTQQPKGPVVKALHQGRTLPVAFIDDMAHNLHSVRDHVDGCLLIHLVPVSTVQRFAPAADAEITRASDWNHAAALVAAHIAV
ncbi:hypothetical protein AB4Z52_07795 [Rhizobium sp. 2YAF20]|uniref:hypothetical protein n=1 Tax=Rhizobium sp. 2YAF20 TaxID=3233027 RepID=UPI003F994BDF